MEQESDKKVSDSIREQTMNLLSLYLFYKFGDKKR